MCKNYKIQNEILFHSCFVSHCYPCQTVVKKTCDYIRDKGVKKFKYNLPLEINNSLTPKTWKNKLI